MIDGPRLPAKSGAARALVVLLHGYGADGNDLVSIGGVWRDLLPEAAFVAPHAPEPCEQNPAGRQWFGLTRLNPQLLIEGAQRAAGPLNAFLDAELARLRLAPDRLVLVGFSQGTMMSLYVGLRRPALGAILGYSGLLIAPERLGAEIACRPPVLLIHGDADATLPVEASYAAASDLGRAGLGAGFHIREGLGHGIDEDGIALGGAFLRAALDGGFAGTLPPEPLRAAT